MASMTQHRARVVQCAHCVIETSDISQKQYGSAHLNDRSMNGGDQASIVESSDVRGASFRTMNGTNGDMAAMCSAMIFEML
jgi:hypothetical protein